MKKTLFDRACNIQGGILESRMIAREETEGRPLLWDDTKKECQYILETIDAAGYSKEETAKIKKACRYILNIQPKAV